MSSSATASSQAPAQDCRLFIALNPEEVVMATEAERLRTEVEQLGIRVHHFPYYEVGKVGGSFRCNTCPIYREN